VSRCDYLYLFDTRSPTSASRLVLFLEDGFKEQTANRSPDINAALEAGTMSAVGPLNVQSQPVFDFASPAVIIGSQRPSSRP
jgi:hypothetical protein